MRFVLVHGASHRAWCWDLLVPELKRLGHEAVPLDLPGAGARANEAATLSGYRDAVVEQLAGDDILVGHSMGAAVAVVAADARPDLVRHITLLSGPLPVEGQCLSYQSTSPSVGGSTSDELQESVSEDNMTFTEDGSAFTGIAMARTRPFTTTATRTWSTGLRSASSRSRSLRSSSRSAFPASGRPTCRVATSCASRTAPGRCGSAGCRPAAWGWNRC
jgi:pimeloyl-ACP methyl ester carboxylesterase